MTSSVGERSLAPPSLIPGPNAAGRGALRVLVIDRDATARRAAARALLARGLSVDTAEGVEPALDLMRARPVDAVILAHDLAALEHLRARHGEVQVVMLVPHADPRAAEAALAAGAHAVLRAPIESVEVLVSLAQRAAERGRLGAELRRLEERVGDAEHLGELVTASAAMNEIRRRAMAAATSSAPILVLGEIGTGRSLLARTIHRNGSRARAPLVRWSAAGAPPAEAAAELASALSDAEGGTLLVEGLEALPPSAQGTLAAALTRRGRDAARVIATATPRVREQVASGELRAEVFYGVASVLLEMPPLRRRRDDIPVLAYHFLARVAAREGKTLRRIGPEALKLLRDAPWPGNVGELRAAIEQAVVTVRGDTIHPKDLPLDAGAARDDPDAPPRVEIAAADVLELPYAESKERAIAAFDRVYLARCMRLAGGNVSEAARIAGMDRSNFRRLSKRAATKKR